MPTKILPEMSKIFPTHTHYMVKYPEVGRVYAGNVVKVAPFGVYIKLEGFIYHYTGFLHVQQMVRNGSAGSKWNMAGKRVFIKVHNVRDQDITRSMKDVDQKTGNDLRPTVGIAPHFLPDKPEVGNVYVGKVLKWNTKGYSVRLEGLKTHWLGLLFKSELYSKDMKINDKVYVLVTSVINRRVSLSKEAVDQETGLLYRTTNADQGQMEEVLVAKRTRADYYFELQIEDENLNYYTTMYEELYKTLEPTQPMGRM